MTSPSEGARQRLDLRTLFETSRILDTSLELDVVLHNLLLVTMSKLLVTRALVLLFDPLTNDYTVAARKGIRSVEEGEVLDLDLDSKKDHAIGRAKSPALERLKIALQVPISHRGRHIGLLGIGRKADGKECSDDELEFLESLVNMSSAAIHNSLMVGELQEANRDLDAKIQELNTLFDLSKEFNATRDRDRLIKLLSFALMGQLLVNRHLFLLRNPQETGANGWQQDFTVVAAQAISNTEFSDRLRDLICDLPGMFLIDDDAGEEWDELASRGISIVLPLTSQGTTQGALCLGPKMTGQPYKPGDIEFLYALGNLALTSIQNTYLLDEQIEKERLEEEIRVASEIQERLLPQHIPDVAGLEIASYVSPSFHVAGDYLDVVQLTDGQVLLAIADVTGKGVPAALLMANIQACLRLVSPMDITIEEATARINQVIYDNTDLDRFITFFWGFYDPGTRVLTYINAGHEPPFQLTTKGELIKLETGGLLLGVFGESAYERGSTTLSPGDLVVMYTDGLTEAMDPEKNQFGVERIKPAMEKNRDRSAHEVLDALLDEVEAFTKGAEQSDDLTLLVLKSS